MDRWLISLRIVHTGLAFTIGGLAAIAAFVGGFVLIGPSIAEQAAVQNELAAGDGVPRGDGLEKAVRGLPEESRDDRNRRI